MIVDAAEDIVLAEGSAQLSVRKIARRIGYAPGTLYQHFNGIKDVVTRVNGRTLARLRAALHTAETVADPRARLHRFAELYLDFLRNNQALWGALFQFTRIRGEDIPAWYGDQIDALIDMVSRAFQDMGPSSAFPPRQAAEMIWASVHAVCSLDVSGKLPLILERPLEQVVQDLVSVHISAYDAGM